MPAKESLSFAESEEVTVTLQDVLRGVRAAGDQRLARRLAVRVRTLKAFRAELAANVRLTLADRKTIVDQAITLFEQAYSHLPLKRSMHAVDPVQRLRLLRFQLDDATPETLRPEAQFHRDLSNVFTSVRDLHTVYLLPEPFKRSLAFLPFTVGEYFAEGDEEPKYLVTGVMKGFAHPSFQPGARLLYSRGVPMSRAVEIVADQHAGSNMEARRVRGLARLTMRTFSVAPAPDEEWVDIQYLPRDAAADAEPKDIRIFWNVYARSAEDKARDAFLEGLGRAAAQAVESELGGGKVEVPSASFASFSLPSTGDLLADELTFDPASVLGPGTFGESFLRETEQSFDRANGLDVEGDFLRKARNDLFSQPEMPLNVFVNIPTSDDSVLRAYVDPVEKIGILQIATFHVDDVDRFVREVTELLPKLPPTGLILDVRGNAGGYIPAGERLLQLLTPHRIEPERFQFFNSPLILEFCRRHTAMSEEAGAPPLFESWIGSIQQSVATGAVYSRGFPVTPADDCNDIGQRYYGPVVLLTDALCYSTTDIFAAGFQDHEIGPLLGMHGNTGAGGASTITHRSLVRVLRGEDSPLRPLPHLAGMQMALRRSVRVRESQGTPVEDLGVQPDHRHRISRGDAILGAGPDLYARCREVLEEQREKRPLTFQVDVGPLFESMPEGFRDLGESPRRRLLRWRESRGKRADERKQETVYEVDVTVKVGGVINQINVLVGTKPVQSSEPIQSGEAFTVEELEASDKELRIEGWVVGESTPAAVCRVPLDAKEARVRQPKDKKMMHLVVDGTSR